MSTLCLRTHRAWIAPLVLVLAPAALAAPQEPPTPPQPDPEPPSGLEALHGRDDESDEMVELFHQVEQRLREIDRMLFDASAGRPLSGAEESGIGELLKRSQQRSQEVLEGIDRILELAQQRAQQQQQQQQQSGGQQGGDQQGGSPLDRQQQGQPGEREQTPQGPGHERPETQGEQQQPQPEQDGGDPDSPRDSQAPAENREGGPPPAGATEHADAGVGADRWGDLPIHVRDLFRAQGGGDLPPRYRDWIDSYYRRLNQKP